METLIASNDQAISNKLRASLAKLGIDCSHAHLVSHDSAQLAAANYRGQGPVVIFFGSQQLADNDLAALSQLCAAGSDGLKVVAVGPNFSASAILQAVRSGAVDCLSLNDNFESELRHLIDRLQVAPQDRARQGQLFTVIAPVGGGGASMLATNLAAIIARRQQQCALLDLHWRGGDLATFLNSSPRHTLLSLAGKLDQLDRTMFDQTLVKHDCGVHLLASPEPFSDYRQIRPELIQKVVQLARAAYATTVVDLEDCEHLDQVRTLAASDQIIVLTRPDFLSLVRAKKLLAHLTSSNVNREHLKLVVNRTGQPKELPQTQIEEALAMRVGFQIPEDPVAFNEAINVGVPLVLAAPKSKAALAVAKLAESLIGSPEQPSGLSLLGATWLSSLPLPLPLKSMSGLFSTATTT